jgi:hypothetical protein
VDFFEFFPFSSAKSPHLSQFAWALVLGVRWGVFPQKAQLLFFLYCTFFTILDMLE